MWQCVGRMGRQQRGFALGIRKGSWSRSVGCLFMFLRLLMRPVLLVLVLPGHCGQKVSRL